MVLVTDAISNTVSAVTGSGCSTFVTPKLQVRSPSASRMPMAIPGTTCFAMSAVTRCARAEGSGPLTGSPAPPAAATTAAAGEPASTGEAAPAAAGGRPNDGGPRPAGEPLEAVREPPPLEGARAHKETRDRGPRGAAPPPAH